MSASKLLNIFALSTLAILLCSFAPSQTLALAVKPNHLARHLPSHHGIAKKKKRDNQRCKPRSSGVPSSSSPPPANTPASDGSNNNNYGNNYDTTNNTPVSSSTSPPASVSTTPPTTNTPSGPGKLAIAWAMGDDKRISFLTSSPRVKMFHLWDVQIPASVQNSGIPVSIMLWGTDPSRISNFLQYAKPGYASHAMGFNEVNEPTQSNIDPASAVSAWYQYLKPLASQGYTLGGPSTTSAPNGFDWMTTFLNQCGADCGLDEMLIHWYDVKFEDFQTYVNKWAGFGKPIRITEFACQNFNGGAQPSMDDIWSFTNQAIPWLENNPQVLSYAPFGFMDDMYNVTPNDCLFTPDSLSTLGWSYVNGGG